MDGGGGAFVASAVQQLNSAFANFPCIFPCTEGKSDFPALRENLTGNRFGKTASTSFCVPLIF